MTAFKINLDAIGHGTIEVGGVEIADKVQGLDVRAGRNNVTEIYLQMIPGTVQLEGEGIVYVLSSGSVKKFLDGLDSSVVKAMALESMGWGDSDPILAAVNVIKLLGDEFDGDQS